jgi:DEAD/DEAH box helicase domain-containing protein
MQQIAQLLLMCDRHDIGISIDTEHDPGDRSDAPSGSPNAGSAAFSGRIFVYDNYPGGIGFSEPLFRMRRELLEKTRTLIAGCACESGCPGCVGPVGNTGPLAKVAALAILDRLLAASLEA